MHKKNILTREYVRTIRKKKDIVAPKYQNIHTYTYYMMCTYVYF